MAIAPSQLIVCIPRTDAIQTSDAPCVTTNGIFYQPVMQQAFVLDQSQAEALAQTLEPIDAQTSAYAFSFAFAAVIFCYTLGQGVGIVLKAIKHV